MQSVTASSDVLGWMHPRTWMFHGHGDKFNNNTNTNIYATQRHSEHEASVLNSLLNVKYFEKKKKRI